MIMRKCRYSFYFLISTVLKIGKQPKHSSFLWKKNVNIKFIFILEKRKIKVKRHNCKIIYVFSFYSLFYKLSSLKQTKKYIILYSVFIYIFSIPFHSNFVWNSRKLSYNTIGFYSYFEKIQIKSKLYM